MNTAFILNASFFFLAYVAFIIANTIESYRNSPERLVDKYIYFTISSGTAALIDFVVFAWWNETDNTKFDFGYWSNMLYWLLGFLSLLIASGCFFFTCTLHASVHGSRYNSQAKNHRKSNWIYMLIISTLIIFALIYWLKSIYFRLLFLYLIASTWALVSSLHSFNNIYQVRAILDERIRQQEKDKQNLDFHLKMIDQQKKQEPLTLALKRNQFLEQCHEVYNRYMPIVSDVITLEAFLSQAEKLFESKKGLNAYELTATLERQLASLTYQENIRCHYQQNKKYLDPPISLKDLEKILGTFQVTLEVKESKKQLDDLLSGLNKLILQSKSFQEEQMKVGEDRRADERRIKAEQFRNEERLAEEQKQRKDKEAREHQRKRQMEEELREKQEGPSKKAASRRRITLQYATLAPVIGEEFSQGHFQEYLKKKMGDQLHSAQVEVAEVTLLEAMAKLVARERVKQCYQELAWAIQDRFSQEMLNSYLQDSMGKHWPLEHVQQAGQELEQTLRTLFEQIRPMQEEKRRQQGIEMENAAAAEEAREAACELIRHARQHLAKIDEYILHWQQSGKSAEEIEEPLEELQLEREKAQSQAHKLEQAFRRNFGVDPPAS